MRERFFGDAEFIGDEGPVPVEAFEAADEIGEHVPAAVEEPIELITMRRGMDAGRAAKLDPLDEFVEGHFVFHLHRLGALVQGDDAVPRVADEAEFEVALELSPADLDLALARKQLIERGADPVGSAPELRPGIFHQRFDLHQIQMRDVSFAQHRTDAG